MLKTLSLITDTEMAQYRRGLERSGRPFTDADIETLWAWIIEIRLGASLLQGVLAGQLAWFVHEGEVQFTDPQPQDGRA